MLIPFSEILSEFNLHPNGVLHIGAWDGIEMDDYAAEGITNVIFIEAQISIFNTLLGRIRPYENARALNYCVSDKCEIVNFNITNNGQSSSLLELGKHADYYPDIKVEKTVPMKACTIEQIFERHGLDKHGYNFVNCDIQGGELKAIKGMGGMINNIQCFYLEVNEVELYKGCPLVGEVEDYLAQYNFKKVKTKMTEHFWGDAIFIKQ
jgi:FkbM family methyltransferase